MAHTRHPFCFLPNATAMCLAAALLLAAALCGRAAAQAPPIIPLGQLQGAAPYRLDALAQPALTPAQLELIALDNRFAAETEKGGGKAFAMWFSTDATLLSSGEAPILGQVAIAQAATWDPARYRLSWQMAGAAMLPGGNSGYTWGHWTAMSADAAAHTVTRAGRYVTVWQRVGDSWQVALESSSEEPMTPAKGKATTPPR